VQETKFPDWMALSAADEMKCTPNTCTLASPSPGQSNNQFKSPGLQDKGSHAVGRDFLELHFNRRKFIWRARAPGNPQGGRQCASHGPWLPDRVSEVYNNKQTLVVFKTYKSNGAM
jgi:hypothetical protein